MTPPLDFEIRPAAWPAGLALGNPDLPNRNPLKNAPPATTLTPQEWANLANVTAVFDPLPASATGDLACHR